MILVACSCGWNINGGVTFAGPTWVILAPHVQEMVRHWQDGHRLSCQSSLRYQVRDLLKRYRQLQRAQQRGRASDDDGVERLRRVGRNMGFRVETYDPFTDEWSDG